MEAGGAASPGGRGLFRGSTSVVVDDAGVAWFELGGDCTRVEAELDGAGDGEEVPEVLSFFDDLLVSLARESCSC